MRIGGSGGWEWIIILVIVLLVFGVGRIGKIAGELGGGIRAFREGLKGEDEDAESSEAADEEKTEEK
ncbi:MAG TPA: twin-arginine translocase TatA/TatE family subunit [Anaerolineales bacterium]|jgi:sec-independent protein translocase protein TatA|nr:twin-arginine translocase TatA/TatE family subunit [Anaerolineales bacterium]